MTAPTLPTWLTKPDAEALLLVNSYTQPSAGTIVWYGFHDTGGHVILVRVNGNGGDPAWFTYRDSAWRRYTEYGELRPVDALTTVYAELRAYNAAFVFAVSAKTAGAAQLAAEAKVAEEVEKMNDLIRRAHQYADGKRWCSEFDDICRHLGIPSRLAERIVTVTIPLEVKVNVGETRNDDDAENRVDHVQIAEVIYNMSRPALRDACDNADYEVGEITRVDEDAA